MPLEIGDQTLPTVNDLRANRSQSVLSWCNLNGLRLDEWQWLAQANKDAEATAFAAWDAEYEKAKASLVERLSALTVAEQAQYFGTLAWKPNGSTKQEKAADYVDRA